MPNHSQQESWCQMPQDERLAISRIHVTAPAAGLRRIPAGFYVTVEIGGDVWRTKVKAEVPLKHTVQWDEVFILPADTSTKVFLRIFAAYETERMLGRGELMHEADLTVGELLRHSSQLLPILFSPHAGESTSLLVKVDRNIKDESDTTHFGQRYSPGSGESLRLGQMTEIGQNLLTCYRRTRCISDYHAATEQLRLTLDHCGSDHPDRAAALTNLADALAIHPHIEKSDSAINTPISLYQEALGLRKPGHPDRPLALLKLGFAFLYRYQLMKNPTDVMAGQELLSRAQGASPDDNDTSADIGASGGATNSTPTSHRSSPAPPSPPSLPSQVSSISTVPQHPTLPEALCATADFSTRSAPMPTRVANGESMPVHKQAEASGDEKEWAAAPRDEIKVLSPASHHSTPPPAHLGAPYINSVPKLPHLPPVILTKECSARPMVPPVDMRVVQPSPLTSDPFLPLPVPAVPAPSSFLSSSGIVLLAGLTSLSVLLYMAYPSYL